MKHSRHTVGADAGVILIGLGVDRYANELGAALGSETGKEIAEGGTASGTVHRVWGELKGKLGGDDHTLLDTAEQGEDVAKRAYEAVLKMQDLPTQVRTVLESQQSHILTSHDKVKEMRDSIAA